MILNTKHFKKFDFPKPVCPVTKQCGYYSKSTIMFLFVDSWMPKMSGITYLYVKNSWLSIISRRLNLFGYGKYMSIWKVPFLNFS